MNFLFRSKPANSLSQALQLLEAAHGILRRHNRTKDFLPTPEVFEALDSIINVMSRIGDETAEIRRQLRPRKEAGHE